MRPDSPNVITHPPVLFLGTLIVSLLLRPLCPAHIFPNAAFARISGGILIALGIGIAVWGRQQMVRVGTNINPTRPTTAIVQSGPYRFTRNPLYISLTLLYLGLTALANAVFPLFLLVPVLLVMHFGVVRREERYLEGKFGETYLEYKRQVHRYI